MKPPLKTSRFNTPDESPGFLLWRVTNLWQREIKRALSKHTITHSQFVVLATILWFAEQKETVTQIKVSSLSNVDPMTTSSLLRTLEKRGFVRRKEHDTDTRAKTVVLTSRGRMVAQASLKTVEQFDADFFSQLKAGVTDFNKKLTILLKKDSH